jgi:hypothetical protein
MIITEQKYIIKNIKKIIFQKIKIIYKKRARINHSLLLFDSLNTLDSGEPRDGC